MPEQGDQIRSSDSDLVQSRIQIVRQAHREEADLRSSQEVQSVCQGQGQDRWVTWLDGHGCRVAQAVTKNERLSLKASPN